MAPYHRKNRYRFRKRRAISLYDAVAGRVGFESFLLSKSPSKYRDTTYTSRIALPPEDVLLQEYDAPPRYVEDDIYSADRHLEPSQELPDSDLLKALHAYASDFFIKRADDREQNGFYSLDETALLALGIFVEEAAAWEAYCERVYLALEELEK